MGSERLRKAPAVFAGERQRFHLAIGDLHGDGLGPHLGFAKCVVAVAATLAVIRIVDQSGIVPGSVGLAGTQTDPDDNGILLHQNRKTFSWLATLAIGARRNNDIWHQNVTKNQAD